VLIFADSWETIEADKNSASGNAHAQPWVSSHWITAKATSLGHGAKRQSLSRHPCGSPRALQQSMKHPSYTRSTGNIYMASLAHPFQRHQYHSYTPTHRRLFQTPTQLERHNLAQSLQRYQYRPLRTDASTSITVPSSDQASIQISRWKRYRIICNSRTVKRGRMRP
jgi:hypothetical protein